MARIELASCEDLPEGDRHLLESLSAKEGLPREYHHLIDDPQRDVYRAIGRNPPLLEPFRTFGRTVWNRCGVGPRRRELAILTVAREFDAEYEWHQHVRIGLKEGLAPGEIHAIGAGEFESFSGDDRVLVRYVRSYVSGDVDDETIAAFVDTYDEAAVVGIGLLAGVYVTVALLADALQLETEEPFVGWDLSNL